MRITMVYCNSNETSEAPVERRKRKKSKMSRKIIISITSSKYIHIHISSLIHLCIVYWCFLVGTAKNRFAYFATFDFTSLLRVNFITTPILHIFKLEYWLQRWHQNRAKMQETFCQSQSCQLLV